MGSISAPPKPLKRKGSASTIIGYFTRQSSAAVSTTTVSKSSKLEVMEEVCEDQFHGIISANAAQAPPYINPLGHKLLPRIEDSGVKRPVSSTSSQGPPSGITKARHRGMAQRQLNGDSPPEYSLSDDEDRKMEELLLDIVDCGPVGGDTHDSYCSLSIETIANKAARDKSSAEDWDQFLRCYSNGNYNTNNLPEPPPLRSGFEYLSAPRPSTEDRRIEVCNNLLSIGPKWNRDCIHTLILSAKGHFNARHASLSFFNPDYELFLAETGYKSDALHRQVSIGSHALLTPDVLVLLDTRKDWRFKNSPITRNAPKVRFWAGTPMLSSKGVPLGVFAVWSRRPRDEFSPTQRRELAAYGAMILEELLSQAKKSQNPNFDPSRSHATSGSPRRCRSVDSEVLGYQGDTANCFPNALRLSKEKSYPHISKPKTNGSSYDNFSGYGIDTPPSSSECDKDPQYDNFRSFGNGREERSSALRSSKDLPYQDILDRDLSAQDPASRYSLSQEPLSPANPLGIESPGCGGFNHLLTRPYSSASDLSSFHQQPPNSPANFQNASELSREPNLDIGPTDFPATNDDLSEESGELSEGQTCPLRYQPSELDPFSRTNHQLSSFHEQNCTQRSFPSSASRNQRDDAIKSPSEIFNLVEYSHNLSHTPLTSDPSLAQSPKIRSGPVTELPEFSNSEASLTQYQKLRIPRITISNTWDTFESLSRRQSELLSSALSEKQLETTPGYQSQIALALCEFAQSDHYDLMYLAEVKPTVAFSTDAMLFAPDGLQRQVLAAFGMERRMSINARIHIETLRTRGFHSYFAKGGSPESGAMIAVCVGPGSREKCSTGLILGAFRMSGKRAINRDESARLKIFTEEIKLMVQRERGVPRSTTDPGFEAYPAKEAIEVSFPRNLRETIRPWR